MPINPIAPFLKGLVTPQEVAQATKLSADTCRRLINEPTHSFKLDVAQDIHTWFVKNFGDCHLYQLFHEDNITVIGRRPYTGKAITQQPSNELSLREIVCPNKKCNLVTPRALPRCVHCDTER